MKALQFAEHGAADRVGVVEVDAPEPARGEVAIALRAAAFNHLDLFVLAGMPGVSIALPHIGGADGAGVIICCGEGVTGWTAGEEVVINPGLWCGECEFCRRGEESLCVKFGVLGEHRNGTFAEVVCVPASSLARRPAHLSWEEAAAFPLTWLTAWRMLVSRAGLRAGETILIHGIGSGVALAALAIAVRLGARVLVTSSDNRKLDRARSLGADAAFNYTDSDVVHEVRAATAKRGADVIVDTVGEATWMASLRAAARAGRIVTCGATSGPNPKEEIRLIFWNQLSILGSTMGSVSDWNAMVAAVESWRAKPVIDTVLPFTQAREGYLRLASGRQFGKVVVRVGEERMGCRASE